MVSIANDDKGGRNSPGDEKIAEREGLRPSSREMGVDTATIGTATAVNAQREPVKTVQTERKTFMAGVINAFDPVMAATGLVFGALLFVPSAIAPVIIKNWSEGVRLSFWN